METSYHGLKVDYLDMGKGDLVILLHGWGSNKELYLPTMNVLAGKYRVVAPDMPGFGGSEEPDTAWNVDDYCNFAKQFVMDRIQEQNGEHTSNVILAGHSHGGRVLLKLLGQHKIEFQVSKLILIDSAGIVHEKTKEQQHKINRYKRGKKILNHPIIKFIFPNALERFQNKSGSADYQMASVIMRQSLVKVVNEDMQAYLPKIHTETLLIWGEEDKDTPVEDGKLMEHNMANAGLAVLKGAGHYCFIDKQFQFLAVMKSFLQI